MNELINLKEIKVRIDRIKNDLTKHHNVSLSILRLDEIHPQVSGNKYFKLYYFLQEAVSTNKKIITYGGAYSNHLAATASACKDLNINCIGIVRGEQPKSLSHTLLFCKELGMQLKFISREDYRNKTHEEVTGKLTNEFGEHILIPEGGFDIKGMKGASLISNFYNNVDYTHICCSVGTATTLAGLINSSRPHQNIIGFSALKNLEYFEQRIQFLLSNKVYNNYSLINDYHFGGFAKYNKALINFMKKFYTEFNIPTDFVYTAKMMFGVFDLIEKKYFVEGSKILCIHTGGLQGNISLPADTLNF